MAEGALPNLVDFKRRGGSVAQYMYYERNEKQPGAVRDSLRMRVVTCLSLDDRRPLDEDPKDQSHDETFEELNGGPLPFMDNGLYPLVPLHATVSSGKRSAFLSRLLAVVLTVGSIGVSPLADVLHLGRRRELSPCTDDLLGIPSTLIIEITFIRRLS